MDPEKLKKLDSLISGESGWMADYERRKKIVDPEKLKTALDAMCFRDGANRVITETGNYVNHTNKYIQEIANYFGIELTANPTQEEMNLIITNYKKVFKH